MLLYNITKYYIKYIKNIRYYKRGISHKYVKNIEYDINIRHHLNILYMIYQNYNYFKNKVKFCFDGRKMI